MSVNKLVSSRNLFINTDDAPDGDGRSATFNVPPGVMDCKTNQTMRITLSSFNMREGFYSVNEFNNVFYIVSHVNNTDVVKATRCEIAQGDYRMFWTDDDNLNSDPRNWTVTSTNPLPKALVEDTLGTAIKAALINSTTHDITMTETNGKFTYTAVVSNPAFQGPNTFPADALRFDDDNFKGAENAVPNAITVAWTPLKGVYEIFFKEVAQGAGEIKFLGFYVKNFVPQDKELNIYQQIITTPTSRNDIDMFQSSFELVGGCGETRDEPTGNTVSLQFNNLRPLFTFVGRVPAGPVGSGITPGSGTSIVAAAGQNNITIANNPPTDLPITQYYCLTPDNLIQGLSSTPQWYTKWNQLGFVKPTFHVCIKWVNNGTVANSFFDIDSVIFDPPIAGANWGNLQEAQRNIQITNDALKTITVFANTDFNNVVPRNTSFTVSQIFTEEYVGQYKATLQSEECIYVRTNLLGPSLNYQTLGFDTSTLLTPEIQPSQILAKIPLNNPLSFQQYFTVEKEATLVVSQLAQPNTDTIIINETPNVKVGDMIKSIPSVIPPETKIEAIEFLDFVQGFKQYKLNISTVIGVGGLAAGDELTAVGSRIEIYRTQVPYEFLNYEDNGNNLYSLSLTTPHVPQFKIFITDSYGRPVPFASREQGLCRALSFSCDLRIDTFEEVITRTIDVGMKK